MHLLALNKQWAVYGPGGSKEELDTFAALRDLLSVKTYQQLVKFLIEHTCNDSFLVPSNTFFADSYDHEKRIWRRRAADIDLQGNLDSAISRYPDIDYLDGLVTADLKASEVFQLDLTELMVFQKLMRKFLTIAGIAMGAKAPIGLFAEIPSKDIFDEDWIRDNVHCSSADLHTIGLKQEAAGFKRRGLFSDDALDCGIFNQTSGYSSYQLVIDHSKEFGKYTDGFPFSIDGVIYTYTECCSPIDATPTDEERSSAPCDYYVTVSFLDNVSAEEAKLLLAGRVVEAALNSYLDLGEQDDFSYPCYPEQDFDRYRFIPGKGFFEKKIVDPPWWVTDLYDEAKKLITEGKVSLCPVCGSPVLIRDFRGRKSKLVCSDSCKTKASNLRRESAYQCAASGVPLEDAIERIGPEYAGSVRKWYVEAKALIAQ